ncbi:MAG: GNAT family N-acetyltransferase [Bacillota bacterium]
MTGWRDRLTVRLAEEADVRPLRLLVNAAYRELAEMGMNYTGSYQDEEITRERMQGRDVYLVFLDGQMVGTISTEVEEEDGQSHLYISQFAVLPELKLRGIGRFIMDLVEQKARENGISRLRLDTATTAHHLVRFYSGLGYRVIAEEQWQGKTYRSYIMEKELS